ncbi:MAG: hypothetical protein PHT58_06520 [Eubacteriales bacterium]|nr:hypothetical protein [Eubacteriales bacterium]
MKRLIIPTLVTLLLLACPAATLEGAKVGMALWWNSVFPALLPFFICCGLLEKLGFTTLFANRRRIGLLPVFVFGALSGYPSGARLLGGCLKSGVINSREAQTLSYITNLCSPTFLITIISFELYQNKRVFLPILLAQTLTVLIFAVFLKIPTAKNISPSPRIPLADALTDSIMDSMLGLLRVGGCIVFCSVLLSVIFSKIPIGSPAVKAVVGGIVELTNGCKALVSSGMTLRLQLAFIGFFTSFGGLSIALQTLCFLKLERPLRYIGVKFFMGVVCGIISYLLTPLFVADTVVATLSISQNYVVNALTVGGILFCSLVGMVFVLLLALIMRRSINTRKC